MEPIIWHGFRTRSAKMMDVLDSLGRFARFDLPVLISGESGTGKELAARTVHALSRRSGRPMVTVDCSTVPESLAESELFGFERGSFTGADRGYGGRIEGADGSSLFLDEVNSIPLSIQSKLLRFLEEGELPKVGRSRPSRADVRLIAATNAPLEQLVNSGKMRSDLYHRLSVLRLPLPPLRERLEDLPLLIEQFFAEDVVAKTLGITRIADTLVGHLGRLPWSGNIRELWAVLRRASLAVGGANVLDRLAECDETLCTTPTRFTNLTEWPSPEPSQLTPSMIEEIKPYRQWMRDREREYFENLMHLHGTTNRRVAASGVPARTLYRKIQALGLGSRRSQISQPQMLYDSSSTARHDNDSDN